MAKGNGCDLANAVKLGLKQLLISLERVAALLVNFLLALCFLVMTHFSDVAPLPAIDCVYSRCSSWIAWEVEPAGKIVEIGEIDSLLYTD